MELCEEKSGRRRWATLSQDGQPEDPELLARRLTYQGFGNALAMAFEMVMTPLLFGLGGYGLDRWLGMSPLFTLALSLLAIVGMSAKMWYAYEAKMQAHDAAGPWAPTPTPSATASASAPTVTPSAAEVPSERAG